MLNLAFKHSLTVFIITLGFLWPQITHAIDLPKLISPSDNSLENKSPKLVWEYSGECVESGSCFRVEVDNNSDFSSAEKSTYTNNFSYSPQGLTENTWYWRVKAKDTSGNWSDWSNVYKFTISPQGPSPSANTQTPQTPQPSPTSQKQESNFSIKDTLSEMNKFSPLEINSNQEFEISVSLFLPNNRNQSFYLKGAFKASDSSNYFGETNAGGWIKNSSKYSEQFKITTNSEGKWDGKIKLRPDSKDSGFKGTGSYNLKVGRYSESGSGPYWSNELTIKINAVEIAESKELKEETPEESEQEEIDFSKSIIRESPKSYEISKLDYELSKLAADTLKTASVAGVSEISNNTTPQDSKVLEEKQINWVLVLLGLTIFISGSGFIYYKFRKGKLNAYNSN